MRTLAADVDLKIGAVINPRGFFDQDYLTLLSRHFALVIPEHGQYMSHVQPEPGVWTFAKSDTADLLAQRHDLASRYHSLVWGVSLRHDLFGDKGVISWTPTPRWVHNRDMSRDEAIVVMRDHIETVMRRYAGRIDEWHVVNEPLGGDLHGARVVDGLVLVPNVWLEKIGPDYIELAFKHARRVDPGATLILNEWGADYVGKGRMRTENYYDLVVHLLERGTPIDGVGFQFHLEAGEDKPSVDSILRNFSRYHALGLSTHITELDVRIRGPLTVEKLREQARLYKIVFRAALLSPSTKDVVLWEFTDRYSWITSAEDFFPDHVAATIMDEDLRLYPSFQSIRSVLEEARNELRE